MLPIALNDKLLGQIIVPRDYVISVYEYIEITFTTFKEVNHESNKEKYCCEFCRKYLAGCYEPGFYSLVY